MQLWVGLGNPGGQYALNRHNIGFMALDAIAEIHGFSAFKSKFQGALSEGRIGHDKILLLKPMTFMNKSGQSIGETLRFYKLEPDQVTIFHDELDLDPMRVKAKTGGGHAGHNGLRSAHQHIGPDYHRIRIGIGHPGHKARVTGHVLGNYSKEEMDALPELLGALAREAEWLAQNDHPRYISEISRRLAD